jgi:hypothetical protein
MDLEGEITSIRGMKVKELDEYAEKKGFKVPKGGKGKNVIPSGLPKKKKQEWLIAAIIDQDKGISVGNTNAKKYSYDHLKPISFPHVYAKDKDEWKKWLFTHGIVVIRDVITEDQIADLRIRFWRWLQGCNPSDPINPADPSSWSYDQIHPANYGIFKTGGAGQELFMWMARTYIHSIFADIFDCDDLVSSMDTCSLLLPKKSNKIKLWLHADQPRGMKDQCCYQGILNLTNSGPENGGFVFCKPDSASACDFFNEYMDKHQSCGISWSKVDPEDPMIDSAPMYKVCARPGSLILYNSQLIHCNAPAMTGHREALYISMQLRQLVEEETQKKRDKAFANGLNTGHWCYGPWYGNCGKQPNVYGDKPKLMPTYTSQPDLDNPMIKLLLHGEKDNEKRAELKKDSMIICEQLVTNKKY